MYYDDKTIERIQSKRSMVKLFWDRSMFPVVVLLSSEAALRLGLTPLDEERIRYALPFIKGELLDIGCGENLLVRIHGRGVGVDVYPWPGVDYVAEDCSQLPFASDSYDTVTMIASLNHIPNRRQVLLEVRRLLRADGRLVVTMITPHISWLSHKIRYKYDPDQHERGMLEGEVYGFTRRQVIALMLDCGFILDRELTFLFGLNRVYAFRKAST